MGSGELLSVCEELIQGSRIKVNLLDPRPYDKDFFSVLRGYHAVLIPSISEEQPRLIYDAFSQGIPVIGSNTDGIRQIVNHGKTGMLTPTGDPCALSQAMKWAANNLEKLKDFGLEAIKIARQHTHAHMHDQRWGLLSEMLDLKRTM